ncbi:MAG: hypothetical protein PHV06_02275 [bacterium]|nr:hypothetical protein [bacterium]
MRQRRNADIYQGGIHVSRTEISEYLAESNSLIKHITGLIKQINH